MEFSFKLNISEAFSVAKNTRDVVAGKVLKLVLKEVARLDENTAALINDLTIARNSLDSVYEQLDLSREANKRLENEVYICEQEIRKLRYKTGDVKLTAEELEKLNGKDPNYIGTIKMVRERLGLGLKEAKDLVDAFKVEQPAAAPTFFTGVSKT